MFVYIYIYIYIYTLHTYIYIYIYIYIMPLESVSGVTSFSTKILRTLARTPVKIPCSRKFGTQ